MNLRLIIQLATCSLVHGAWYGEEGYSWMSFEHSQGAFQPVPSLASSLAQEGEEGEGTWGCGPLMVAVPVAAFSEPAGLGSAVPAAFEVFVSFSLPVVHPWVQLLVSAFRRAPSDQPGFPTLIPRSFSPQPCYLDTVLECGQGIVLEWGQGEEVEAAA